MFGSNQFQWLRGSYYKIGYASTLELPLSDADANLGTLKRGKMVDLKTNDETKMAFTTGHAMGILERPVDLYGTTGDLGFKNFTIGLHDLPAKRGACVSIRVPQAGAEAIFEGIGAAGYDTMVITATTTGFLTAASARGTELTVEKGGWRTAVTGEWVLARLEQANYTPSVASNIRIRVQFVNKYKKSA